MILIPDSLNIQFLTNLLLTGAATDRTGTRYTTPFYVNAQSGALVPENLGDFLSTCYGAAPTCISASAIIHR